VSQRELREPDENREKFALFAHFAAFALKFPDLEKTLLARISCLFPAGKFIRNATGFSFEVDRRS
jgi:hypothetical protein